MYIKMMKKSKMMIYVVVTAVFGIVAFFFFKALNVFLFSGDYISEADLGALCDAINNIRFWLTGDLTSRLEVCERIHDYMRLLGPCALGAGLAFSFGMFAWMIAGCGATQVRQTIKENKWIPEEVEYDILSGTEFENAILGRKYVLINIKYVWFLYRARDIVQVFLYVPILEYSRLGMFRDGSKIQCLINLKMRDEKIYTVVTKTPEEARKMLDLFEKRYPHILFGDDEDLGMEGCWNFKQAMRLSDEKDIYGKRRERRR